MSASSTAGGGVGERPSGGPGGSMARPGWPSVGLLIRTVRGRVPSACRRSAGQREPCPDDLGVGLLDHAPGPGEGGHHVEAETGPGAGAGRHGRVGGAGSYRLVRAQCPPAVAPSAPARCAAPRPPRCRPRPRWSRTRPRAARPRRSRPYGSRRRTAPGCGAGRGRGRRARSRDDPSCGTGSAGQAPSCPRAVRPAPQRRAAVLVRRPVYSVLVGRAVSALRSARSALDPAGSVLVRARGPGEDRSVRPF